MSARTSVGAEARWRALIAEQERRGEGVAEFAKRRGVSPATLYWWRSRLRQRSKERLRLVPVELEPATPGRRCGEFTVELRGGRAVRVAGGFDADELARLIVVVERAC